MEIEAVVLAAGYSSRANGFKMAMEVDGKPVLQRVIEAFSAVCTRIYVVSGYRADEIQRLCTGYARVQVVHNPGFDAGMFSSVQTGVRQVHADRFFFTPGDYPLITADICRQLLAVPGEVVAPVFEGRKGHPVLLSGTLAEEIAQEPPDSNLKQVLGRKTYTTVEVGNAGVLLDLDSPDDYAALRRMADTRGDQQ